MIYHKDDLTKSNLKDDRDATAQHGLRLVGSASVDRNSSDVKEAFAHEQSSIPTRWICKQR